MQTFALLKLVPDTVEELTVAPDGKSLETQALRFKLGHADEHALEHALLLKERHGGTGTVGAAGLTPAVAAGPAAAEQIVKRARELARRPQPRAAPAEFLSAGQPGRFH